MKSLETMARYKKELTECARNLKLPFLAEHLDEILHEAQEKQQTYSEFLINLSDAGTSGQGKEKLSDQVEICRIACKV